MRRRWTRATLLAVLMLGLLAPAAAAAGATATRASLDRDLRRAGPASGAMAIDLDTGRTIFARRATTLRVPASVNKLNTTAALLRRLGPDATLFTDVLVPAPAQDGVVAGNLFLRGGGDFTFGPRQARRLARALADAGIERVTGRVIGDESRFDTLRGPPSSGFRISPWVGPLSALSYERGLTAVGTGGFQSRPALHAAQRFHAALRRSGIRVKRRARTGTAPMGAELIMRMPSPPVRVLAARTNVPSDNYAAETLMKVLGAQFAGDGTTAAGAKVVRDALSELGVLPQVVDGSGLSRANQTSPAEVVTLLREMDETPDGAAFRASLPVAGRSGTLSGRMRRTAAEGRCQAKTGTLTGVSALAGYCTTAGGGRVAFAFLMNGVDPYSARQLQDRMTAALAAYEPAALGVARR
jgi:D-alanyl-D-alanine carboxypeptidase/D-alanyl-D-alanine-endopeptidase (penicillin-binding protein 4)